MSVWFGYQGNAGLRMSWKVFPLLLLGRVSEELVLTLSMFWQNSEKPSGLGIFSVEFCDY